jgi:hypothetical protein
LDAETVRDGGDGMAGLMKRAPLLPDLHHCAPPEPRLWFCDTKTMGEAEVEAGPARNES